MSKNKKKKKEKPIKEHIFEEIQDIENLKFNTIFKLKNKSK